MSSEITLCAIERDEKWCRTCKHYNEPSDRVQDIHGECRRHAPTPRVTLKEYPRELFYADWPLVRYNDHCGDWDWDTSLDSWIDDPDENPRA
jgi:hypothetical protein